MRGLYSKHDYVLRKFVPSAAKASYNPFIKLAGNAVAAMLRRLFPELHDLPPNHLCLRVGAGNRIVNGHINFIQAGNDCWLKFLSRNYCTSHSDVVELGCGCGRLARPLRGPHWSPWFEGTYVGVDIDSEMIEYCRGNFPADKFKFILSPHRSMTYSSDHLQGAQKTPSTFVIADEQSKDYVYSLSLYSHLLEEEVNEYLKESYRILRTGGIMYLTFFCIEHVELGGRWTFQHQRNNAYIESVKYPEAAVAYDEAFMIGLARKYGFSEVMVFPGKGQSELVAWK
jgi:SAM-dependent methyltransferase